MSLIAARLRCKNVAGGLSAPNVVQTKSFTETGAVKGDRPAVYLNSAPTVGNSLLLVFSATYGALNSIDAYGTTGVSGVYAREGATAPYQAVGIYWVPSIVNNTAGVVMHLNASFNTEGFGWLAFEISGMTGATILDSVADTAQSALTGGGTYVGKQLTVDAADRLFVAAEHATISHVADDYQFSPAGARPPWTAGLFTGGNTGQGSYGFVKSQGAGTHYAKPKLSGSGRWIGAAVEIG